MPGGDLPRELPWDKLNHLIGYGGLTLGLVLAGWRIPRVAILVLVYGLAIEYAQLLVPGRSGGDWADIIANALGIACVALPAVLLQLMRKSRR